MRQKKWKEHKINHPKFENTEDFELTGLEEI